MKKKEPIKEGTKLYFAVEEDGTISGHYWETADLVAMEQQCMPKELLSEEKGYYQLKSTRLYVCTVSSIRQGTEKDFNKPITN